MLRKILLSVTLSLALIGMVQAVYAENPPAYCFQTSDAVTHYRLAGLPSIRVFPLYWPDPSVRYPMIVFENEENQLVIASWTAGRRLETGGGLVVKDNRTGLDIPADTVHHVGAFYYNDTHILLVGYKSGEVASCLIMNPGQEPAGFYCAPALDVNGEPVAVAANASPSALMVQGWDNPILMVGSVDGTFTMYWMNADMELMPQGLLRGLDGSPLTFGPNPSMGVWDLNLDNYPEAVVGNSDGEIYLCNGSNLVCWPFIDHSAGSFGPAVMTHRAIPVFNDSDKDGTPELYIGGDLSEVAIFLPCDD